MSEFQSPSVWQHKPWWCQPWSILLTGITLIGGSWLVFKIIWLTIIIAIPILTWIYPKLAIENGISNITDEHN
jgi:hypothetical protein